MEALKPEYGPTLGELLAPRWRRARPRARWLAALAALALLVLAVGLLLALEGPSLSHGGAVPFSFSYKGLERRAPEAGAYAKAVRVRDGRLEDSFTVAPLSLPAYSGSVTGAFPLYATGYIRSLAARYHDFVLVGQGPIRTAAFGSWEELPPSTVYYHVPTYTIAFTTVLGGRLMYGRDVWLVPNKRGARTGVDIRMLAAASARGSYASALSVGTTGALSRPMRSFSLGA